jgi:hypothetical protein
MLGVLSYLLARGQRQTINRGSSASNPARLIMSDAKLRRLCPSLYCLTGIAGFSRCFFWNGWGLRYYIGDMLIHGDSRAAVVVSVSPLLVACYCDDLDGVCVLRFPDDLAGDHRIEEGDRLIAVLNSWGRHRSARPHEIARDLVQGRNANPRYVNFWPLIAEFLTDDREETDALQQEIYNHEYEWCEKPGKEHLRRYGGAARDGRPDRSMRPAEIG